MHLQELCAARREKVAVRSECLKLVPAESIQENTIKIVKQETKGDRHYINAKFHSPLAIQFPHLVRELIDYLFILMRVSHSTRFHQKSQQLIFNLFYHVIIVLVLIQFQ